MRFQISPSSCDNFIYLLLQSNHQAISRMHFLLNSTHLLTNEELKNILTLFLQSKYHLCYDKICEQPKEEETFYSKLSLFCRQKLK